MKKIIIISLFLFCKTGNGFSQIVNWKNLTENQKHLIHASAGVEHGLVFGLGYGYHLRSRMPIIVDADYSFPGGKNLFDDFKTTIGAQVRFYKTGNFIFTAKLHGIFRRYQNDFARLLNFGSDLSAAAGYYKIKWSIAAEAGFDKAIVTHFKHSTAYKMLYPGVKDGWYEPSTGGNLYYGMQAVYSTKSADVFIRGGKIVSQDFKTDPLVPFFIQLGFTFKLSR